MTSILKLIIFLMIPVFVGSVSGYITSNSPQVYAILEKPAFSPPAYVFAYVWTILYLMMGFASYIVCMTTENRCVNILIKSGYIQQLIVNFFWSILFFSLGWRLISIFWMLILLYLVYRTIVHFKAISLLAGYLLYPYFAWICFALYLNIGFYVLNR